MVTDPRLIDLTTHQRLQLHLMGYNPDRLIPPQKWTRTTLSSRLAIIN